MARIDEVLVNRRRQCVLRSGARAKDVHAMYRVLRGQATRNAYLQAFRRSLLTDSNRRPLLTMRSEMVAVGCHWLPIRLVEPL